MFDVTHKRRRDYRRRSSPVGKMFAVARKNECNENKTSKKKQKYPTWLTNIGREGGIIFVRIDVKKNDAMSAN